MATYTFTNPDGTTVQASPRINGLIGSPSTYQTSLDATSARYTKNTDPSGLNPLYTFSYRFTRPAADAKSSPTSVNVTVKVGNFIPASGYSVQLTTLSVNGVPVTIPAANPPFMS